MTSKVNPRCSSQSFNKQSCYKCNKNVFQLEQIIVGDHSLHESCFVCEVCNQRLTTGNYVEFKSKYYCLKDSHAIHKEETQDDNNNNSSVSHTNTTGKNANIVTL